MIKAAREKRGLSLRGLAAETDLYLMAVHRMEKRLQPVKGAALAALARVLELDPDVLEWWSMTESDSTAALLERYPGRTAGHLRYLRAEAAKSAGKKGGGKDAATGAE